MDLNVFKRSYKSHFRKAICNDDEMIVTHVSNFRKVKRVEDVVKTFAYLRKAGVKAKLLMLGDGPERIPLEALCRELGVCQDTRFLGKQDNVEEILSVTDLFLMPSGSETFGLAALEAMSCSVPVISSDVGGLPELNRDGVTGYVCALGDTDAMGAAAVKMLTDKALHQKMAKAARHRAEDFEQEKVIAQYEEYYMRVLSKLA